jgi:hypothetical protein
MITHVSYDICVMTITRLAEINNRISKGYCSKIDKCLTDQYLLKEYMKAPSVKNAVREFEDILTRCMGRLPVKKAIVERIKKTVIKEVMANNKVRIIPAGTKATVRGSCFNDIVHDTLTRIVKKNRSLVLEVEQMPEGIQGINERPDWYIMNKDTKRFIIGYNQIDFWGGGQQSNRGDKYILKNEIDDTLGRQNGKLLCVVCKNPELKSINNKIFHIFDTGFTKKTLCYVNDLEAHIKEYLATPA